MSQSNFVSLCGYFMSCDTPWLFPELSAGPVRQTVVQPSSSLPEHQLQPSSPFVAPSWRRTFSTSNNQKTRVDIDINSDYKASSFDKLYIRRRKWDTAGFVRAHKRKYWNALTVDRGHADDGWSCNHRAVPPSVMAWCLQAKSHYLSQCWPRSLSPYGVTRPQSANHPCLNVKTVFAKPLWEWEYGYIPESLRNYLDFVDNGFIHCRAVRIIWIICVLVNYY